MRPVLRLSALATLLSGLLAASPGLAVEPGAPEPRARTALLLFVSYRAGLPVFPDPTRVRHTASRLVADALTGPDREVLTYPAIESTMRDWRVRSERDLGFGFLGALASELDVASIVVGTLTVAPDRIVLLIRESSIDTWNLQKIEVIEGRTNPAFWNDAANSEMDLGVVVGRAVRGLVRLPPITGSSGGRPKLVLLPLRPVGAGRGYADLAMYCLLGALLESGRWSVPDPALTVHALQEAGFDPLYLSPRSRAALASRFDTETFLVPRLAAFPGVAQTRAEYEQDLDLGGGPSFTEGVGRSFHFSVVAVDSRTGAITSSADTYLAPDVPYGTFGLRRDVPVARRFQDGAEDLVDRLLPKGRE